MFAKLFKRKKGQLYFVIVVADAPLEDAQFSMNKDCKYFVTAGETVPGDVIPRTVLRGIVDRFVTPPDTGVKISEKRL